MYTHVFVHICIHIHIVHIYAELCLIALSRLTLCDPTDCSPAGSSAHRDSLGKNTAMNSLGKNTAMNTALQSDSLPSEPQGKPKNTGLGSLSLLQGIFPIQESNRSLLHCSHILYQLNYQGSPHIFISTYNI